MLFPSHYSVPARARPPRSRSTAAGGRKGGANASGPVRSRPATAGQGVPGRHRPDIKKRRALPDPPFQPTAPPCCHPPIEGERRRTFKKGHADTPADTESRSAPLGTKKRRTHPAPPSPSTFSSSAAGIPPRTPAEDERFHLPTRKTAPFLRIQKNGGPFWGPPPCSHAPPGFTPEAVRYCSASGSATRMRPQYSQMIIFLPARISI